MYWYYSLRLTCNGEYDNIFSVNNIMDYSK